jgi:hypothetical protein
MKVKKGATGEMKVKKGATGEMKVKKGATGEIKVIAGEIDEIDSQIALANRSKAWRWCCGFRNGADTPLGVTAYILEMSSLGKGSLMRVEQAATLIEAKKPTVTAVRRNSQEMTENIMAKALKNRILKRNFNERINGRVSNVEIGGEG